MVLGRWSKLAVALAAASMCGQAHALDPSDWEAVLSEARGQTVYFAAWAGSPEINAYVDWIGERVESEAGVTLEHLRIDDAASVVAQLLAEKAAGKTEGGSVDLLWLNGENFAALKRADMLFGPFAEALPNAARVDFERDSAMRFDFTVPIEGYESPWGRARFVLIHDAAITPEPPGSAEALLEYAQANPGRVTYPAPPDFVGSTFLKQILHELTDEPGALLDAPDDATFERLTEPLWDWLVELHRVAWRRGESFPTSMAALHRLFEDGEVDLTMAFNAAEASSLALAGRAPETARAYAPEIGSIGNAHYVAIPANAANKAGALVVADALLSVEAQVEKAKPEVWGDPTVLAASKLTEEERALFEAAPRHPATPSAEELGPALPEPHPAWLERIEATWRARFGG